MRGGDWLAVQAHKHQLVSRVGRPSHGRWRDPGRCFEVNQTHSRHLVVLQGRERQVSAGLIGRRRHVRTDIEVARDRDIDPAEE